MKSNNFKINPFYEALPKLDIDFDSIFKSNRKSSYLLFAQKAAALLAKSKHIYISKLNLETVSKVFDDTMPGNLATQTIHNISFKIPQAVLHSDIECNFIISDKLFKKDEKFINQLCGIAEDKRSLDNDTKMIIKFGYIFWKVASIILNATSAFNFIEAKYNVIKTFHADVVLERVTCIPWTGYYTKIQKSIYSNKRGI